MRIVCSIYVHIALSFLCTVSAGESNPDKDVIKLEKFMKRNFKNSKALNTKVTNLEEGDMVLNKEAENLNGELVGTVVEFDAQVTNLNEYIADLGGELRTTTDDINGSIIHFDGTVTGLKVKIKFLEEALKEALKVEKIQYSG